MQDGIIMARFRKMNREEHKYAKQRRHFNGDGDKCNPVQPPGDKHIVPAAPMYAKQAYRHIQHLCHSLHHTYQIKDKVKIITADYHQE